MLGGRTVGLLCRTAVMMLHRCAGSRHLQGLVVVKKDFGPSVQNGWKYSFGFGQYSSTLWSIWKGGFFTFFKLTTKNLGWGGGGGSQVFKQAPSTLHEGHGC